MTHPVLFDGLLRGMAVLRRMFLLKDTTKPQEEHPPFPALILSLKKDLSHQKSQHLLSTSVAPWLN